MQPPHQTAWQELTKECPPEWQKPPRQSDLAKSVNKTPAVTGQNPANGGFSACALAFSTLLSSQGADAHRHQANQPDTGATLLTYLHIIGLSNPVTRFFDS